MLPPHMQERRITELAAELRELTGELDRARNTHQLTQVEGVATGAASGPWAVLLGMGWPPPLGCLLAPVDTEMHP